MNDQEIKAEMFKAINYLLVRQQEDPDLRYQIGYGTEAFRLLCRAFAVHEGIDIAEVERMAQIDRQPAYRKREPEIPRLRRENEELRAKL